MPKTLIKFGNISKRLASRNSKPKSNIVNECNSIEKSYRTINNVLENKSGGINVIKQNATKILESLADSNLADKYIFYPISIIEKLNNIDSSFANYIMEQYSKNIIPYINNVSYIIEGIDEYNLSDKQKETILKEANIYNTCDRILNNHSIISKRFNLEDIVLKNKYNIKAALESVCSIIDTYNREPYQKMNICLEEMFYIIEKNKIECNKCDVVNSIVEYFLLSTTEISDKIYKGMKKCIIESSILTEDESENIIYLSTNREDNTNSNIKSIIASYLTGNKDKDTLEKTIIDCIDSDTLDITYNFSAFIDFLIEVYKFDRIYDSELEVIMSNIETTLANKLISIINNALINREDLANIISQLNEKISIIDNAISSKSSQPRLLDLMKHMKSIYSIIIPYYDNIYTNDNINTINTLENCIKEIPLSEGLLWKSHNVVTAIRNLDKYLGEKCKNAVNKLLGRSKSEKDSPSVLEKINKVLFNDDKTGSAFDRNVKKGIKNVKTVLGGISDLINAKLSVSESYNPYEYISEETRIFDMILADIPFEEDELSDIHTQIASICKEFNYILEHSTDTNNCKVYYLINPNNISLHLAENARYILNEDDIKAIKEANKPDIENAFLQLAEAEESAEFIDSINNKDIESSLFSYFTDKDMNSESFESILECLSYIGIDKSIVKKFANKYIDHKYYSLSENVDIDVESKNISSLVESYDVLDNVPNDIKLEAYLLIDALLEANYDDDDDIDDEDDIEEVKEKNINTNKEKENLEKQKEKEEIKKNPFKGINLNSMKLYIQGLKAKFSRMNQKQKELSKSVDSSFKHLVDSFKNAMISDSRESVIKGSVIPSFSRCLKVGIPAAVGIGTGLINPGVAAIAAVGSFAVSKHLTKKERILLLDEIETELDVVDKEISMAEREEDMKRYRALLQYKKNLQRQYQRIRYNVKIPGSNKGVPGNNNNDY